MTNWQRAPVLFSSPSSRVPLRMDMDEPVDMIRTCKGTHEGVISHSLQTVNSKIALHVASAFDELPAFGGAREILSVGLNATPLGRLQISSKSAPSGTAWRCTCGDPTHLQIVMHGEIPSIGILLGFGHHATKDKFNPAYLPMVLRVSPRCL